MSDIEQLFFPGTTGHCGRESERKITKLEARWLPRRGYDLEGYPRTLLLDEKNAQAILRVILFRRGTDIIEATLETDEEKNRRLSGKFYWQRDYNIRTRWKIKWQGGFVAGLMT